jgi:LCP family protein required for cell wall assembly
MIDEKAPPEERAGELDGTFEPLVRDSLITVYKARRPRKRRRWLRVLVWGVIVPLVLIMGAVGGYVYFKIYAPIATITDLSGAKNAQFRAAQKDVDPLPAANQPATALVLGYDHRLSDGAGPSRSDTLMLVRVDPARKTLALLSLPRDLAVTIPGYSGTHKLNEAYSLGRSRLALDTVKQLLGPAVPINYLIPVDFAAFRRVVDTFGGVYIDVDRRYYNRNLGTTATDYSNINLQPGYQWLSGGQALQYVRYRHTDSDIYRLARQQAFVREFKRRLDLMGAIENLPSLANTIKDTVKVIGAAGHEPGLTTMARYAKLLASIPRSNMAQVRLVGDGGANSTNGAFVYATPTEIANAEQEFLNPPIAVSQALASRDVGGKLVGGSKAKPKHPAAPVIPPGKLRVAVLNASGVGGVAHALSAAMRADGYPHAEIGILPNQPIQGDAWREDLPYSYVYYTNPKARTAAKRVAAGIGDAAGPFPVPPQAKALTDTADVVVAIGKSYAGFTAVKTVAQTLPKPEKPDVQPMPSTAVAQLRAGQRQLRWAALVPARIPTPTTLAEPVNYDTSPVRVYFLKGQRAMHATFSKPPAYPGAYVDPKYTWDIQWTRWTDAPILADPTQTRCVGGQLRGNRCVGGHLWMLYFNGSNLHRIAVLYGKGGNSQVAWIDNSLSDYYSVATMKAIAQSLQPLAAFKS